MVTVKFIRDMARRILKEFGVTRPPVPVREIVEGHALKIEEVEREEAYDGELIPELRLIRVNSRKPITRQRFTLAHELGHWVLFHKQRLLEDDSLPLDSDPEGFEESDYDDQAVRKTRDAEANTFAAELLMPTQWFRADWKTCRDVKQLAQVYEVSEEAMWRKVMDMKLIK